MLLKQRRERERCFKAGRMVIGGFERFQKVGRLGSSSVCFIRAPTVIFFYLFFDWKKSFAQINFSKTAYVCFLKKLFLFVKGKKLFIFLK